MSNMAASYPYWDQPIKAGRKELRLWYIPRKVAEEFGFRDGTKRRLRIRFRDGTVLEQTEFSITSGIEISFDARSQTVVKKYIRSRTASDFRVEILDMAEDELVAVEAEAEVRDAFLRWHQALRAGTDGGQGMSWRLAFADGWVRLSAPGKPAATDVPDANLGLDESKGNAVVEINVPSTPGDANGLSTMARDRQGRLWILRQGRLHGSGDSNVTGERFDQVTSLDPVTVRMSKPRGRTWYRVAMVDGLPADIQRQTSAFVAHCALVRAQYSTEPSPDQEVARQILARQEVPYDYVLPARGERTVTAIQAHVWQALKEVLDDNKINSGKPERYFGYDVDMVVEAVKPLLVEIKTSRTSADVYTGVGQLMLYGQMFPGLANHRRVLLLPCGLPEGPLRAAVENCGIQIAAYEEGVGGGFIFSASFLSMCGVAG